MELRLLSNVRQAIGFWMQAALILWQHPILLAWQIAIVFLLTLARRDLMGICWQALAGLSLLSFFNAFLSHYTMRSLREKSPGYTASCEAALSRGINVYLFLFLPFLYFFFHPEKKLFFALPRILFLLLVVLLFCIFCLQHVASVIVWSETNSSFAFLKQAMQRACQLVQRNLCMIILLTGLFFSACLLLALLLNYLQQIAGLVIPDVLQLAVAYYIITVSLNLYCMALMIFYYEYYVKHELRLQ